MDGRRAALGLQERALGAADLGRALVHDEAAAGGAGQPRLRPGVVLGDAVHALLALQEVGQAVGKLLDGVGLVDAERVGGARHAEAAAGPDLGLLLAVAQEQRRAAGAAFEDEDGAGLAEAGEVPDRKSTRLNSSHGYIPYAVFCLKKKQKQQCLLRMSGALTTTHMLAMIEHSADCRPRIYRCSAALS